MTSLIEFMIRGLIMETVHLSSLSITIAASVIGSLLAIIAFFLSRLLKQFDGLTVQVSNLNDTMKKIDKDLSGQVGVLQTRLVAAESGIEDLNPLWNRTRKCEERIAVMESMLTSICKPHTYGG